MSDHPDLPSPRLGRRAVLLGAAGLGLAACTAESGPMSGPRASSAAAASTSAAAASAAPSTSVTAESTNTTSAATTTAVDPLPASAVWSVPTTEPEPTASERGVRVVEALSAWSSGQSGAGSAAGRLQALGLSADRASALVAAAASFLATSIEATSRVISAQYGGLTSDQASVLVTFEQWTRDGQGKAVRGGSAADVRVARTSGQWAVTELHAADPGPALAGPSSLVRTALAHPHLHLPPSAAADLAAGNLTTKALTGLLALADRYDVSVSIVHSAHPTNVFATTRLSDHTRKRAFDVWAVDGRAVVAASTPNALVDGFMRAAADVGGYNVGGPRQLSGAAFFSDQTHRDHVHVGYNADT